jgi:hypothetical protein
MSRTAMRVVVIVGLLAATLATASPARAAGEVVVAVSPTTVTVGRPVEVLVRTFRVVEREDLSLPFETPLEPYPVPSGVWNVLYHWADYPFDVVAQHEDGTDVPLTVARDPNDSTLWRGVVSLPKPGTWTIWVRNFSHKEPGSTAVVTAQAGSPGSVEPQATPTTVPASGERAPAVEAGPAAVIGALVGLFGGWAIGRFQSRRRPS